MQKIFISPHSTLHNNIGNCLQFQADIDEIISMSEHGHVDYELVASAMAGYQAMAHKPQSLGKWQSSVLLYAMSSKGHGYGPVHLLTDISLMSYCLDEKADSAIVSKIAKIMIKHPDRTRAMSWRSVDYAIRSNDKETMAALRRDLSELKKEARQ